MARRPLPTSSGTVALRPVASPVDTYVQPAATNGLMELGKALEVLEPKLTNLFAARAEEQKEKDLKQADADHLLQNADGLAEGVRRGEIPAHHSETYVKRRKALEGMDMGRRLRAGLSSAYDAWEGKSTADDAATDAFVLDYIRSNIGTDDPDILAGAVPAIRQMQADFSERETQFRSRQEREGALRAELSGVNAILDDADEAGIASGQGANHSASADAIERQRQAYIKTGGTAWDFDRNAMELIAVKAVELGDEDLLGFFDRTVPGETYTYGSTPEGSKLKAEAAQQLAVRARQAVVEGDRVAEAERKAREDAAQRAAIEAMVAGGPVSEEVLAAGEKADPLFRTRVGEWRENLSKGNRNPDLVRQVEADIMNGQGVQAVIRAAPHIESSDDLNSLLATAKSFEGARPSIMDVLNLPTTRSYMEALGVRTGAAGSFVDPMSGLSDDGLRAQGVLRKMVMQWVVANPNASEVDREEALQRMGQLMLGRLQPDPVQQGLFRYVEPGDPAPEADPAEQAPRPALVDNRSLLERLGPDRRAAQAGERFGREQWQRSEDGQYFRDLSPEEQAAITETAAKRGEPLANVVKALRQMGAKSKGPATATTPSGSTTPDGTPVDPVAYRPDEPDEGGADARPEFTREMANSLLQAVMSDPDGSAPRTLTAQAPDAQAAHLLDLIGEHEAAGNYNAVFGNAGSTRDLSSMTLDQILGQQQAARRRGVASTAIGRYQFIYKTLRGLKEELGLTGQERFDSALQDRLGMALLERRGWNEFRAGKLSRRQFALRLSQEFASMPDPRTGRSFYHSDGLNRAGTSTQAVYAALGFQGGPSRPAPAPTMAAYAPTSPAMAVGRDPYANMPEAEREQFRTWNSDPVANHEANLGSIDQTLAGVVRRAQELSGVQFVVGSGKRDKAMQKKAKEWGWSKTDHSDHEHGSAVDLWGIDANGAVTFDPETQRAIVKAMKSAAKEMGVDLDVGAEWRGFTDNPHFALKGRRA